MDLELKGKRALITGSSAGLGEAITAGSVGKTTSSKGIFGKNRYFFSSKTGNCNFGYERS